MSSGIFAEDLKKLPPPIVEKLLGILGRIRRVFWLRGAWMTAAAGVASILVVMAADAIFDFQALWLRWLMSVSALAVTIAVAVRYWVRPLTRKVSLATVARLVEEHHPEMQERLSSAVELLSGGEDESLRGSEELLREVVKGAVTDAGGVTPEAEFSAAPARAPRWLAIGVLGILALALALWPFHTGLLLIRALAPFAAVGNAASFQLRVMTGDVTVTEGEPLNIVVAAKGRAARRVELHRVAAPGTGATIERMSPDHSISVEPDESAFALRVPEASESFRYFISAGRARTREFTVSVTQRPEVVTLEVVQTFPTYTGLPAKSDALSSGDIMALAGTRLDFTAHLDRPAAKATVQYDQTEEAGPGVDLAASEAPTAKWSVLVSRGMNIRWRLLLTGERGIDGRSSEGVIRAVEDLPPAVVIDSPVERELTLRPDDRLPLVYTAADDFGFSAVDLRVQPEGGRESFIAVGLPEKDPAVAQTWHGTAPLELSKLPLVGVSSLRVLVRVTDNLPADLGGPQSASSEEVVIHLNWGAPSFAEQTVALQERELREDLQRIRDDLRDERGKADQKIHQLRNREEMEPKHLEQLAELTQKTAQTAAELEDLAARMSKSAFAERAQSLQRAANSMVRPATAALERIPQSDQPRERSDAAQEARDQLNEALRVADRAMEDFGQDRQQATQAAQLATLARQEQQLADSARNEGKPPDANSAQPPVPSSQPESPEDAASAQAAALEKWREQQREIAEQTERFARQLQGENPQGQRDELGSLADQARQLAEQAARISEDQGSVADAAATPEKSTVALAQQEADVTAQSEQLSAAVERFQKEAGRALTQNGEAHRGTLDARRALAKAAESGREMTRQWAREAAMAAEAGSPSDPHPAADPSNESTPQSGSPESADPAAKSAAATGTPAPKPKAAPPADQIPNDAASPSRAAAAEGAPIAAAAQSLEAAAEALQSTVRALAAQEEGIAAEAEALTAATGQTQDAATAAERARQTGQEAGRRAGEAAAQSGGNPPLAGQQAANKTTGEQLAQQAAGPAQQAANSLALAAANARHVLNLPDGALESQNMGRHGSPTPGGPSQPGGPTAQDQPSSQPGEASEQQGMQSTKAYELPAELAKLGLSPDDWARLRGLINAGSEGSTGDTVPAEYRELVRGYFRALATGAGPAGTPEKR